MKKEVIKLLSEAKIKDDFGSLLKMISMPLSDVFIFKESGKVLKVYKKNSDFFESDKDFFEFIEKDFSFNFFNSPEIYLDLIKVGIENNKVVFEESLKDKKVVSEDVLVLMNYFDENKILLNHFIEGELSEEDFYYIGKSFGRIKKRIQKKEFVFEENKNAYEKYMSELNEKLKRIPNGFLGLLLRSLKRELYENKKIFLNIKVKDYKQNLDSNLGNLIYEKKEIKIFDSYPPKKEWINAPEELNFYVLGADIYFLYGEKAYREYFRGLSENFIFNLKKERFCLLFGAMFSYPYFFYLGSKDNKYKRIVWKYQRNLKKYFFSKK